MPKNGRNEIKSMQFSFIIHKVALGLSFLSVLSLIGQSVEGKTANKTSPREEVALKKVIFLPFYNQDNKRDYAWIETSITLWLDDAARKKYRYIKVPKSSWQNYMKKNDLSNADLFNEKKISEMGKALGADGVVYGRFSYNKETNKMVIEGKILSVIDEDILADKRIEAPLNFNIFDATEELSLYLSERIKDLFLPTDKGALWRSAVLPGWGFFYKQREEWGYIHGTATGVAFLVTVVSSIRFVIKKNEYLDYTPEHVITPLGETALYDPEGAQKNFDTLENEAAKAGKLAKISTYVFLTFYVANLIHSWFIEPDAGNVGLAYLDRNFKEGEITFALTPRYYNRTVTEQPYFDGKDGWNLSLTFYY